MEEKQLIQKKLPENADIFAEIYDFMKQDAWVFISADLFWQLRKKCLWKLGKNSDRFFFDVKEKEKEFILSVYKGCDWNKVESITRIKLETAKDFESYNTSDPKIIVFLS